MNSARVESFLELVYEHDELADLDADERRQALAILLARMTDDVDIDATVAAIEAELFGWGPLEGVLADPDVTDVLVNGPDEIWADRRGGLERIAASFRDVDHLTDSTRRWFARFGGRIDQLHPISDVTADGIRLHAVLPPLAPKGPLLSLRRIGGGAFSLEDLHQLGFMDRVARRDLEELVRDGATLVISGPTGSGKTTLLGGLCRVIPDDERVVIIEETRELHVMSAHAVSLVARTANGEGMGAVSLDVLVKAALRMRPDRIVVGEVRGAEAWTALRAATTGHVGSMLTVHARSASDALETLSFLALAGAPSCTQGELAGAFERAVDAVIHLERDGPTRHVAEIRRLA